MEAIHSSKILQQNKYNEWYKTLPPSQQFPLKISKTVLIMRLSSFGGLEVACWPLVPKFAGSHPAEAVGFSGRKNPQHAFLQRGSKAVGPMSQLYGM
jgi:hypothetical protein